MTPTLLPHTMRCRFIMALQKICYVLLAGLLILRFWVAVNTKPVQYSSKDSMPKASAKLIYQKGSARQTNRLPL